MATDRPPRTRSIAVRLLVGQAVVLGVFLVSAAVVATVVGPRIFHEHLLMTDPPAPAQGVSHIEEAYLQASILSLGCALVLALWALLVVTWYLGRHFKGPLEIFTGAAREVSRGHFRTRVPVTGDGAELDTLGEAFNTMAARLERTEETRRRLLSDLAHEMRTPVATLTAYHDGLRDGVTTWNDSVARVLCEQTARLARLVQDIKDVSLTEEGQLVLERTSHDVGSLLVAARDSACEAYAAKGVQLVVAAGRTGSGLVVETDRQRIEQVLANLLANSLRHTTAGGVVTLSAVAEAAEVVIEVADTGDGIAPQHLDHVFERFFRGDPSRTNDHSGTGIGLTISKAIVDAHGGSLTARSDGPGRGATFTMTLPGEF